MAVDKTPGSIGNLDEAIVDFRQWLDAVAAERASRVPLHPHHLAEGLMVQEIRPDGSVVDVTDQFKKR
jgi:hypothetical protein